MGLFHRKNKKTPEEELEEARQKIWNNNSTAIVEIAVGVHGADEVVAGAMMGETGKLIGMANYGKTKWQAVQVQFYEKALYIVNYNIQVFYDNIRDIQITDDGWISSEFIINTNTGETYLLKGTTDTVKAFISITLELKEKYMETLNVAEVEAVNQEEKDKAESDMDRLIRLGELHERGLLSDEEFETAKKKLL
jgi:hypothetical protein